VWQANFYRKSINITCTCVKRPFFLMPPFSRDIKLPKKYKLICPEDKQQALGQTIFLQGPSKSKNIHIRLCLIPPHFLTSLFSWRGGGEFGGNSGEGGVENWIAWKISRFCNCRPVSPLSGRIVTTIRRRLGDFTPNIFTPHFSSSSADHQHHPLNFRRIIGIVGK
jgi:hypothetical protein